ncbi:MAG TPA: hypothetical protein VFE02_12980 [Candidatus Acidoferrales bacterium]|nr:hypothetical protein [Candidatus Acidoferrales bacterium]
MSDNSQFDNLRQSARVAMRVPVEIRGITADGIVFEETTSTGVIGVHRAMIWTSKALQKSAEVELTNHFSQRTAKFRVTWVNEPNGTNLWEAGVESLRPLDDFWVVGCAICSKGGYLIGNNNTKS